MQRPDTLHTNISIATCYCVSILLFSVALTWEIYGWISSPLTESMWILA
jgi:hypothetical protein